jgi:hypothetical protein
MKNLIFALALFGSVAFAQTQYVNSGVTVEGTINYCGTATLSAGTYSCANVSGATIGAYRAGSMYTFKAGSASSGSVALAIDGLSGITIKKLGSTNLVSGDIASGQVVVVQYDGTFFQMQSQIANVPAGSGTIATTSNVLKGDGAGNATGATAGTDFVSPSSLGTGVATFLATPSSANLAAALTNETGTGNVVFSSGPTLTLANATGLPLTTGVTGTLPVANGGTGTTSPGIVAGTNVTVTGTWPNQTVNSTAGGLTNPMTTAGDIIYGGSSGTPTRLAGSTSGYVLTSNGATSAPSWQAATGGSGMTGVQEVTSSSGTTAIATAFSTIGTSNHGLVRVSANAPTTEALPVRINNIAGPGPGEGAAYAIGANTEYCDYRFGIICQGVNVNGQSPSGNYRPWMRYDLISSTTNPVTSNNYLSRATQVLTHTALSGGVNENVAANFNKSFYFTEAKYLYGHTRGQKIGDWNNLSCSAVGDCAGYYAIVRGHGGFSADSDEGLEGINVQPQQAPTEPAGQIASISGSTVTLTGPSGSGNPNAGDEIGEGRYLVDTTTGALTGNVTAMSNSGSSSDPFGNTILKYTVSNTLSASSINTTYTGSIVAGASSTVTVGSATGMSVGTQVKISNWQHIETVVLTAVSGTSVSFVSRYSYDGNGYVTNAAADVMCTDGDNVTSTDFAGYLIADQVNASYPKHFCIPIVRNTTSTVDVWWESPNLGYQGYRGRWNSSTRAGYHAYKALEITSVKDATLDQLSNTITLEVPVGSRFTASDNFIVPDYYGVIVTGSYISAQKLHPSTNGATASPFTFQLTGIWDSQDTAMTIANRAPAAIYSQGLSRPEAFHIQGFDSYFDITAAVYPYGQIIKDTNTGNVVEYFKLSTGSTFAVRQADGTWNSGAGGWVYTNYNNSEKAWIDMLHPRFGSDLHTPSSSSEACTAGTFWADATYFYACTATNTIKRVAWVTF